MKKNISRQKLTSFVFRRAGGFTLIELIVTVTVIMVLVGAGSVSMSNFNGIKELEAAREQVGNHLKMARNLAITKQLPEDNISKLEYVRVNFDGNKVIIEGVDNLGTGYTSPPYSTTSVKTESGVNINPSSNFGFMKSTGQLTDANGKLVGTTMTVEISRGTSIKTINVSNLGVVSNVN